MSSCNSQNKELWYLKGELAYHFKVNIVLLSYLTRLLDPKLCDPYYPPYYDFSCNEVLIHLNPVNSEEELKKFLKNKSFFQKYEDKINKGSIRVYRVQNPLLNYQFNALQWNICLEKDNGWINSAKIEHNALTIFDNKKDAKEYCRIIDMHVLNLISFSDKSCLQNVKSDSFTKKLKPCTILFDAIVVGGNSDDEKVHAVIPKYVIMNKSAK